MSYLFLVIGVVFSFAQISVETRAKVEQEIEPVNTMRESMVLGVVPPISASRFKAVCGPVGQRLKQIGKDTGWKIRQASDRYRNPTNKASGLEIKALARFRKNKPENSYWQDSPEGSYYFRRIDIKPACLSCHGDPSSMPEFIKKKYPGDKAFGFKVGELRGVYSVFVGTSKRPVK